MRPKLLLLALCLCALGVMLGQYDPALVGMPELGVTLAGTAEHPEVVNNSGRTILGYVILSRDANGRQSFMPILKTRDLRLALVRPTSAPPSGPMATTPRAVAIKPLGRFDNIVLRTVPFSRAGSTEIYMLVGLRRSLAGVVRQAE